MKHGQAEERAHLNIYAMSYRNPYGAAGRVTYPRLQSRAQRVDLCIRRLGRPLSIMKKWPEAKARVGMIEPMVKTSAKENTMAEHKALAAHIAALEKSIEKLAQRRDVLRAGLDEVEGELKSLLAMRKAGAPIETKEAVAQMAKAEGKRKGKRGKAKPEGKTSPAKETALKLISKHGTITPAMLAEETGQSGAAASQTLAVMAKAGSVSKVKRGTFGAAA